MYCWKDYHTDGFVLIRFKCVGVQGEYCWVEWASIRTMNRYRIRQWVIRVNCMSNYWIAAVGNFAALGNFAAVGNFATASMPLGQCSAGKKTLIKNIIDSLSFFNRVTRLVCRTLIPNPLSPSVPPIITLQLKQLIILLGDQILA